MYIAIYKHAQSMYEHIQTIYEHFAMVLLSVFRQQLESTGIKTYIYIYIYTYIYYVDYVYIYIYDDDYRRFKSNVVLLINLQSICFRLF